MKIQHLISTALLLGMGSSCMEQGNGSDGYGHFEATEILLSAEIPGKILQLTPREGDKVAQGDTLVFIDTVQLGLQKKQALAAMEAVRSKTLDINSELAVLHARKDHLLSEKERFQKLVEEEAATQKQLDDMDAEIRVVDRQIQALRTKLLNANRGILAELQPLQVKVEAVEDQMARASVICPIDATILNRYAEPAEMAAPGKPLLKLANLDEMILRVYLSAEQLNRLSIGQVVKVKYPGEEQSLSGTVARISDQAEFTPKNVQTSDEKAKLVYAVEVRVKNNGFLRIGMPGEILITE